MSPKNEAEGPMVFSDSLKPELLEKIWLNEVAVIDNFLPTDEVQNLFDHAIGLMQDGQFRPAHIGRQNEVSPNIRSDSIYWLDADQNDKPLGSVRHRWVEIQNCINQNYFWGITHWEWHFAHYNSQQSYDFHIDQPQQESLHQGERKVSFVLYLNRNWKSSDGGRLQYRSGDGQINFIEPIWNRLVLFRSDSVLHAVETAQTSRWSLTGWFRRN